MRQSGIAESAAEAATLAKPLNLACYICSSVLSRVPGQAGGVSAKVRALEVVEQQGSITIEHVSAGTEIEGGLFQYETRAQGPDGP